eukprot:CAMPEP_0171156354 /NCGR_PEP_ID=MMETSP0790-20130122/1389_1 /TAXON_ID=2925 /ORGANISM="Alexandrium catenella, Strain OF101" /LENGTH=119 /DNA_ID=CAMNT_0011620635 /DNA_START=519 /DNA_END=878 /DNA_ORIENTATION=+
MNSKCLAEGMNAAEDAVLQAQLSHPAAALATKDACAVRLIHHDSGTDLVGGVAELGQRRAVAVHGVHRLHGDDYAGLPPGGSRRVPLCDGHVQLSAQVACIVMPESHRPCTAQPQTLMD